MLAHRVKVKLADIAEEFAALCYADGFGCTQLLVSKNIEITYQPGCEMGAHLYLNGRKARTNAFIKRFLEG